MAIFTMIGLLAGGVFVYGIESSGSVCYTNFLPLMEMFFLEGKKSH